MKARLLYLFLLLATAATAQQSALQGRITDAKTGLPVIAATVLNTRLQSSAYSGRDGTFSVSANPGDVVEISSVGYKTSALTTPAALGRADVEVRLQPSTYKLEEFVVRPHWTPYQADSARRAADYERVLLYNPSGGVMSPISALAEAFSKKKKQRVRFQKDFYLFETQRFSDSRYTPDLVASQTSLSGDTLALFMNRYPIPYDYARTATPVEIKMWIRTNYRAWLLAGRPVTNIIGVDSLLTK